MTTTSVKLQILVKPTAKLRNEKMLCKQISRKWKLMMNVKGYDGNAMT